MEQGKLRRSYSHFCDMVLITTTPVIDKAYKVEARGMEKGLEKGIEKATKTIAENMIKDGDSTFSKGAKQNVPVALF
jgi:hypothetical protein